MECNKVFLSLLRVVRNSCWGAPQQLPQLLYLSIWTFADQNCIQNIWDTSNSFPYRKEESLTSCNPLTFQTFGRVTSWVRNVNFEHIGCSKLTEKYWMWCGCWPILLVGLWERKQAGFRYQNGKTPPTTMYQPTHRHVKGSGCRWYQQVSRVISFWHAYLSDMEVRVCKWSNPTNRLLN